MLLQADTIELSLHRFINLLLASSSNNLSIYAIFLRKVKLSVLVLMCKFYVNLKFGLVQCPKVNDLLDGLTTSSLGIRVCL